MSYLRSKKSYNVTFLASIENTSQSKPLRSFYVLLKSLCAFSKLKTQFNSFSFLSSVFVFVDSLNLSILFFKRILKCKFIIINFSPQIFYCFKLLKTVGFIFFHITCFINLIICFYFLLYFYNFFNSYIVSPVKKQFEKKEQLVFNLCLNIVFQLCFKFLLLVLLFGLQLFLFIFLTVFLKENKLT